MEKVKILSTKNLSDYKHLLTDDLFTITDFDFLMVEPLLDKINDVSNHVIFTSFKATQVGMNMLQGKSDNINFYVVGNKSKEYITELKKDVVVSANYSTDLAHEIIRNFPKNDFSYLCSPDRLDNLPNLLNSKSVNFTETYIYKTNIASVPSSFNEYDVYMWFSPKGIENYNSAIPSDSKHICIGKTTAKAARNKFKYQEILYPDTPSVDGMIQLILKHYLPTNTR